MDLLPLKSVAKLPLTLIWAQDKYAVWWLLVFCILLSHVTNSLSTYSSEKHFIHWVCLSSLFKIACSLISEIRWNISMWWCFYRERQDLLLGGNKTSFRAMQTGCWNKELRVIEPNCKPCTSWKSLQARGCCSTPSSSTYVCRAFLWVCFKSHFHLWVSCTMQCS